MTERMPMSGAQMAKVSARPRSAIHSASRASIAMMPPGRIPSALSVPNSGVRSKVVIKKALTMLKVTSTTSSAYIM